MRIITMFLAAITLTACLPEGEAGAPGDPGVAGKDGVPGPAGSPGKDSTVSGSRLRAVYRKTEDGAREAIGWFDTKLNVRCSFSTATDMQTRCLPDAPVPSAVLFYSGMSCVGTPVAIGFPLDDTCPSFGPYVSSSAKTTCGTSTMIRSIGKKYTGPIPYVHSNIDGVPGSCVAGDSTMFDLFDMGLVEPMDFVVATDE